MKNIIVLFFVLSFFACKNTEKSVELKSNTASLINIRWVLKSIDNQPIVKEESRKEIYLFFSPEEDRFRGFAGCNNISGRYTLKENEIEFGNVLATKMLCDNMASEQTFLKLINKKVTFQLSNNTLTLQNENGLTAIFEAVYLK